MTGSPVDPALARLSREARESPQKAAKAAASQFEQLFLQMLLKSMREATPKFDPLAGDGGKLFQSMLDQQWAKALAERGGIGLAPIVERQLVRAAAPAAPPQDPAPAADKR